MRSLPIECGSRASIYIHEKGSRVGNQVKGSVTESRWQGSGKDIRFRSTLSYLIPKVTEPES